MKAKKGQSIFDLALQTAGRAEIAADIAGANGIEMWDTAPAEITIPANIYADNKAVAYYKDNRIVPATDAGERLLEPAGGIGHMAVSINFIVK